MSLPTIPTSLSRVTVEATPPSDIAVNDASEQLSATLLSDVEEIMSRAERDGTDPDEALRQAVGRAVLEGISAGHELAAAEGTPDERERAGLDTVDEED